MGSGTASGNTMPENRMRVSLNALKSSCTSGDASIIWGLDMNADKTRSCRSGLERCGATTIWLDSWPSLNSIRICITIVS